MLCEMQCFTLRSMASTNHKFHATQNVEMGHHLPLEHSTFVMVCAMDQIKARNFMPVHGGLELSALYGNNNSTKIIRIRHLDYFAKRLTFSINYIYSTPTQ